LRTKKWENMKVGTEGMRRPRRQRLSEVSRDLSTTTQEHWAEEDPFGPLNERLRTQGAEEELDRTQGITVETPKAPNQTRVQEVPKTPRKTTKRTVTKKQNDLEEITRLITTLKETITQQNSLIENLRVDLVKIKADQRTLQNQNFKLQEENRCSVSR